MVNKPEDANVIEEKNSSIKTESPGFLGEFFKFAIIAFIVVIPIRIFIAQPFLVNGSSMSPTFENANYLIIDEISYRFNDPKRGDVIVFKFPNDPSKFFIKRVIGLPNESVEIKNGEVFITKVDGTNKKLEEKYVINKSFNSFDSVSLSDDEYFVMGDNRPFSSDSRFWGTLPKNLIKGRAFLRLFPVNKLGVFPGSIN